MIEGKLNAELHGSIRVLEVKRKRVKLAVGDQSPVWVQAGESVTVNLRLAYRRGDTADEEGHDRSDA